MALRGQPPGALVSHLPTPLPGPQPVFPSHPATSALRSEGLPGESPLPFVTRRDSAVRSGMAETCWPGQSASGAAGGAALGHLVGALASSRMVSLTFRASRAGVRPEYRKG